MKRFIPFMMIICLLFSSCQLEKDCAPQEITDTEEMRGVWISCYDHISAYGKTENEYQAETDKMFETIKNCSLNTAFVHLRAFSDAFYKSDIFPYSAYIAGSQGASLPFDPFEIMLKSAEKYGISVHGWINPFRISSKTDVSLLCETNPARKILESGNTNGEITVLDNGIYYNPTCESNHRLIIDGVREIISRYDIDGIHIDDYFYPSADEEIDKKQYDKYLSDGGALSLQEWRKTNVNAFVSALYSAIKSINVELTVSISPAAKIENNENELFADCLLWLSAEGYADLIIPQIYYGFNHETLPFENTLKKWGSLKRDSSVSLACGIAAYKCDEAHSYYSEDEKSDWQKQKNNLSMQVNSIRKNTNYCGFVVFSYGDLTKESCKEEINNLKEIIKTEKSNEKRQNS